MSEVTPEIQVIEKNYLSPVMPLSSLTVGRVIGLVSEAMDEKGFSSEAQFRVIYQEADQTAIIHIEEIPPATEPQSAEVEDPNFWEDIQ